MDKTLSDGLRVWALHIEDGEHKPEEMHDLRHLLFEAANEIDRLRSGGCARDQKTTQYCGEAVALEAKLKDMHNRFVRLENDYDILRVWCEDVEADNTIYRNEYRKTLDQRDEARKEILRLLENSHRTFDVLAEIARRKWYFPEGL